jgi:hypothetical protein
VRGSYDRLIANIGPGTEGVSIGVSERGDRVMRRVGIDLAIDDRLRGAASGRCIDLAGNQEKRERNEERLCMTESFRPERGFRKARVFRREVFLGQAQSLGSASASLKRRAGAIVLTDRHACRGEIRRTVVRLLARRALSRI